MFSVVFPEASFEPAVAAGPGTVARDEVVLKAVTGWMSHLGPTTASELSELLGIAASEVEQALLRIEKGAFGLCRDCGEPIAEARLNAIPWTRVCITCKEKQKL